MNPSNAPENFLLSVLHTFETLDIPYFIVGGFAAALHGSSRLTIDLDIVIDLNEDNIQELVQRYPLPHYYADAKQIRSSIQMGIQFNLIDSRTGGKIDLIPKAERHLIPFQRRMRKVVDLGENENLEAWVASPEDTIIGKLQAWAVSQSRKHEGDIVEILVVAIQSHQRLDLDSITEAVQQLNDETLSLWYELLKNAQDYG